ncbi:hypothetical protein [Marinicrinis sediminis]|uniref:DUF3791 domain-containing protein n=1 Tax=Marinicrinis sediminis TaxID=1652465 RepID=A0ABW5R580_9BACL
MCHSLIKEKKLKHEQIKMYECCISAILKYYEEHAETPIILAEEMLIEIQGFMNECYIDLVLIRLEEADRQLHTSGDYEEMGS